MISAGWLKRNFLSPKRGLVALFAGTSLVAGFVGHTLASRVAAPGSSDEQKVVYQVNTEDVNLDRIIRTFDELTISPCERERYGSLMPSQLPDPFVEQVEQAVKHAIHGTDYVVLFTGDGCAPCADFKYVMQERGLGDQIDSEIKITRENSEYVTSTFFVQARLGIDAAVPMVMVSGNGHTEVYGWDMHNHHLKDLRGGSHTVNEVFGKP